MHSLGLQTAAAGCTTIGDLRRTAGRDVSLDGGRLPSAVRVSLLVRGVGVTSESLYPVINDLLCVVERIGPLE